MGSNSSVGSSGGGGVSSKKRRMKRWSVLCGAMLFGLGLVSLFAGHVASGIEWYSQRLGHRGLYSKLDGRRYGSIDIWKSHYSKYYYGCSQRAADFLLGRNFQMAIC